MFFEQKRQVERLVLTIVAEALNAWVLGVGVANGNRDPLQEADEVLEQLGGAIEQARSRLQYLRNHECDFEAGDGYCSICGRPRPV